MTDTPKPLMTGTRAAALLEDILKWKLQLVTPEPGVRSVPTDTDGIRSPNRDALPFGLDHVIDTSWSDGPTGTTTEQGVDKWLRFWTPWMSYWAGVPAVWREKPGPWTLKQLTENPNFTAPNTWDQDDQTAWADFTSELRTMHHRLATLTGHQPKRRALCPQCHTGHLQSKPTPTGYEDTATCSNPTCRLTIDHHHNEIAASIRAALRTPDINADVWLTAAQIKTIWPTLNSATLRSWVHRGKVAKHQDLYNLADINQQQVDKLGHPC